MELVVHHLGAGLTRRSAEEEAQGLGSNPSEQPSAEVAELARKGGGDRGRKATGGEHAGLTSLSSSALPALLETTSSAGPDSGKE